MKNILRYITLILIGVAVTVSSLNGQKKKKQKEEGREYLNK